MEHVFDCISDAAIGFPECQLVAVVARDGGFVHRRLHIHCGDRELVVVVTAADVIQLIFDKWERHAIAHVVEFRCEVRSNS